jgi:hypothetical protein
MTDPQKNYDTKIIDGKVFKRKVVRPDRFGVITYTDGFIPEEIDWNTGVGKGWEPER